MRPRGRTASIKPARAADRFFSGKISLVDIRSDHEHRAVHIPCARHIPLGQLRRRVDEIHTDRPVVLLCRSGHRSALATRIAERHGLDAMSVAGGMSAWLAAELPAVWPGRASRDRANNGARPVVLPDAPRRVRTHRVR
jgi:rhodanese-related sulfurtransferase